MTRNGFFQDMYGNNSSSRLLGFIVVIYALALATAVLIIGCITGTSILLVSAASGTIFTSVAGPVLMFMFGAKRNETSITTNT